MLLTRIDDLVAYLQNKKRMTLKELSEKLEWEEYIVERVANILERQEIVKVHYPVNIFVKPWVDLVKKPKRKEREPIKGEEVSAYALRDIRGEFFGTARLVLLKGKKRPKYFALIPEVSGATRAYLTEVKKEISKNIKTTGGVTKTKEDMVKEHTSRKKVIRDVLQKDLAIKELKLDILTNILHAEMFGLGEIESLIADSRLEEIVINTSKIPVLVYHRRYGWVRTNITIPDEETTENLASQIARRVGKQITLLNPVLDAHLLTGDRVNATLFPISSKGNTITLRLFARNPWTITNYLTPEVKSLSPDMAALLWQAVHYEMSVMVAGGTASGKCVSGDTEVLVNNKRIKIEEVVEGEMKKGKVSKIDGFETCQTNLPVLSFDPTTMKIEKRTATQVWKKKAKRLIIVKTQMGKEICVTPEHPFFTFESNLTKIRADSIKCNSLIATPRTIGLAREDIVLDVDKLNANLKYENDCVIARKSRSTQVKIPQRVCKGLARTIGFLIGDGHITKHGGSIKFYNTDHKLLTLFKEDIHRVFGVVGKIKKQYRRTPHVEVNSIILKDFFTKLIGIPSGNKSHNVTIPKRLFKAKKEIIAELIKALFESEAYIDYKKGELEFSSSSKQLVKDVSFVMASFGIVNRTVFLDGRNRLFIAGKHLQEFKEKIGMIRKSKNDLLIRSKKETFSPNVDFMPNVGEILIFLKNRLRLWEKEMKGDLSREAISRYICDKRKPTKKSLYKVVKRIEARYGELEGLKREVNKIKNPLQTKKKLVDLLVVARKQLGFGRKKTAMISGVNVSTLYHWEKGTKIPSTKKMQIVGGALFNNNEYSKTGEKNWAIQQEFDEGIYIDGYRRDSLKRTKKILKIEHEIRSNDMLLERINEILALACSDEVKEKIKTLKLLINSDILWDKIIAIEKIDNKEEFVYDLTVDGTHTFIANNMIIHNTSMLNGVVALIPPFQRVITIEDTRELSLPSYQWNWVPLATRAPNPEGAGAVRMLDLLVNSLRMRPDRIVMGEIRRKKEAEVLFEAMHTGHSVYATMHADTGSQLIKRLVEPPIAVPASEVEDVNLIVVQYRDRRKNIRRTLELCEVIAGVGKPELNHLYRWNARTDKFQTIRKPNKYMQQMNLHTGMTDREISEDLKNKKKILDWMIDQKLTEVEDVGRVMKTYYTDQNIVLTAAEKNKKLKRCYDVVTCTY